MRTKKKITITIDEETYNAVDRASQDLKIPRSQLAQEALSLWLKRQTEDLMGHGYREMAEEDRRFSEMTLEAQREIQR